MKFLRPTLFICLFALKLAILDAKLIKETLTITNSIIASDCYERHAVLVNNQLPGPEIRAEIGDKLEITIENKLDQEFSMHWHGINHKEAPWSDGVPWITQLPIPAGENYVYKFTVHDAGTYYYHSHSRFQAFSALGALVVHNPSDNKELGYDEERVVVLSEYYHDNEDLLLDMKERMNPMAIVNAGDAILVNGKALEPLVLANSCNNPNVTDSRCRKGKCQMAHIEVEKGKKYRFRFINAGAMSSLRLNIPQHKATLVEVDGHLVNPFSMDSIANIDLHIGQRYSFIIDADQMAQNYYVTVGIDGIADLKTAFILHYKDAAGDLSQVVQQRPPEGSLITFSQAIPSLSDAFPTIKPKNADAPATADRTMIFEITMPDDVYKINNGAWEPTFHSHLLEMAYKNPKSILNQTNVYEIKHQEVVDLVVQLGPRFCGTHPWHMHGNTFWDMGGGPGKYNGTAVLTKEPIRRDTVSIRSFPESDSKLGCGWRVLRLKAENAGMWHMHCHIHHHMAMGMQLVLAVGVDQLPKIPKDMESTVLGIKESKTSAAATATPAAALLIAIFGIKWCIYGF